MRLITLLLLLTWEKRVDATPVPEEPTLTIVEGDILIYSTSEEYSNSALNNEYSRWPEGEVFVKFDSSFSGTEKQKIIDAMTEIREKTCVKFYLAANSNKDFILIFKHPRGQCSSHVGRIGGRQTLNLAAGCLDSRKVILHELMHALGFIHEHNRSDRDKNVDIKWGNIIERNKRCMLRDCNVDECNRDLLTNSGLLDNFVKRNFNELSLMNTAYSYESIMHYTEYAFAINDNMPTIVPKRRGGKLGGGKGLSEIDALRINKYYRCNVDPPVGNMKNKNIAWTPGNFHFWWSPGCEFEGHDISSIENLDLNSCIDRCALHQDCMDFTLIGRTCYLKSGPYNMATTDNSHSVKCNRNAICGWKEKQITYPMPRWSTGEKDVWWTMNCDWTNFGTLILEKTLEGRYCGALCREHEKSDGCTHFTWNDSNGGTCYLFKDVESIYPEHNGGAMCGYLDKGLNGVRRRGTAYCL